MKFSLSWLRYFLETEASAAEIALTLNAIGLEVEGIDDPATSSAANAPKGYWMVHTDVIDANRFQSYAKASVAPVLEYGGRFLVRGGRLEQVEGKLRARSTILEFPSYQAALDCYRSAGYQQALQLLKGAADRDLLISEGIAPQAQAA